MPPPSPGGDRFGYAQQAPPSPDYRVEAELFSRLCVRASRLVLRRPRSCPPVVRARVAIERACVKRARAALRACSDGFDAANLLCRPPPRSVPFRRRRPRWLRRVRSNVDELGSQRPSFCRGPSSASSAARRIRSHPGLLGVRAHVRVHVRTASPRRSVANPRARRAGPSPRHRAAAGSRCVSCSASRARRARRSASARARSPPSCIASRPRRRPPRARPPWPTRSASA